MIFANLLVMIVILGVVIIAVNNIKSTPIEKKIENTEKNIKKLKELEKLKNLTQKLNDRKKSLNS